MEKTLPEEYQELYEMKRMIESKLFQDFIVKPLKEQMKELRRDPKHYFNESLKESWRKGGRLEGYNEFFKIVEGINNDFKNKRFELD